MMTDIVAEMTPLQSRGFEIARTAMVDATAVEAELAKLQEIMARPPSLWASEPGERAKPAVVVTVPVRTTSPDRPSKRQASPTPARQATPDQQPALRPIMPPRPSFKIPMPSPAAILFVVVFILGILTGVLVRR
jgi:hypothetical protein